MNRFLSEESISEHKEYHRGLRLRYSIYESSIIGLKEYGPQSLNQRRYPERDKLINLYSDIILHDCFFSSFGEAHTPSRRVKEHYGSEGLFLAKVIEVATLCEYGFIGIRVERGRPIIEKASPTLASEYILAIDLWEHAYFRDWHFRRNEYVAKAVRYLNLGLLD